MTPERWRQIQTVFGAVLDEPADQRDRRLCELCGDDEELAREVASLVAADRAASVVLGGAPAPGSIAPLASAAVPVGTRIGEYEVRSLLGQGGMGTVYAGIHPVIEKEVAIKVLDARLASTDGIVDRFVREARAVNRIRHPNIIDIFAFGHAPGIGHYFVMPRLVGETLGARIARAPMSLDEALPIVEQIADALDAAHGAGVLHRDLKPDNVFLVAARRGAITVQILDFGIAKLIDGAGAAVTRSGVQIGTPLFMSPEQWDGADVDQRTDVYALGVMIHHVLTGRFPFESRSPLALMNMHANHPPPPASRYGAPPAVDAVIAHALAKSRHDRPASTGAVYAALAAAAGVPVRAPPGDGAMARLVAATTTTPSAPVTTLSGSIAVRERPASARGRMAFALIGLVVAAVAVVVFAATLQRHDRGGDPATGGAPGDAAFGATVTGPDAVPPVDAATMSPADGPTPVLSSQPRSTVDARRARSRSVDASPPPAIVVPDARTARGRADAPAWGTTVNPFPESP